MILAPGDDWQCLKRFSLSQLGECCWRLGGRGLQCPVEKPCFRKKFHFLSGNSDDMVLKFIFIVQCRVEKSVDITDNVSFIVLGN